jgi:PspAA-like protein
VIVRISNEGQYRLDNGHHHRLDELDDAVVSAVEAGDEDGYHAAFEELLHFIRSEGEPLEADDLEPSEFILPPADLTFEEAKHGEEFSGEGLIPDPAPPGAA